MKEPRLKKVTTFDGREFVVDSFGNAHRVDHKGKRIYNRGEG